METFSEIERRRLIAILGEDRELFALSSVKIFTSGRDGGNWLDSDLEGFLCFVIDQNDKSKYFYLYDTSTYDKLIQIELYQDFNRYYTVLCSNFHCFEMNHGFIGFRFEKVSEARKFGEIVIRLDDDKIVFNRKDKSKKTNEIFEIIKKNICNKLSKTNAVIKPEFFGDDGIDICKPNHFSLLNTISFDNNKQRFVIGDIPRDLKNLFKSIGLKKSDLKDTSYALNIFKILIQAFETLQNEKKEKTINLCKVKGKYLAEKEVKKTDKPKGKTSFLSENRPNISNLVSKPEEKHSSLSNVPSIPSVPKVPAVPSIPKVPAIPKVPSVPLNPTVNNQNNSQNIQVNLFYY
jgi:hypothetical protein